MDASQLFFPFAPCIKEERQSQKSENNEQISVESLKHLTCSTCWELPSDICWLHLVPDAWRLTVLGFLCNSALCFAGVTVTSGLRLLKKLESTKPPKEIHKGYGYHAFFKKSMARCPLNLLVTGFHSMCTMLNSGLIAARISVSFLMTQKDSRNI